MTGDSACGWPACGQPEVAQLVSALGGGTLSGPAARRLWRHAGGNPLYTRCLIEELDPAVLAAAAGPLPAPRSLATLLVARLAACAPGTQDLVSAAAVLGERCPLALAASLAGVLAPADALGEAVAARLLAENHDEGVRQVQFPHPLVRAAIYADLSPARRAALHLSAARLTAGAGCARSPGRRGRRPRCRPGGRAGGAGRDGVGAVACTRPRPVISSAPRT